MNKPDLTLANLDSIFPDDFSEEQKAKEEAGECILIKFISTHKNDFSVTGLISEQKYSCWAMKRGLIESKKW